MTRVVLDNLHGNLSLKGEDAGDIKVTGRKTVRAFNRNDADRANQQTQVHIERQGDSLLIRTDDFSGPRLIQITTDLDITIPRGISVESRGRTGDLTIDDVDGPVDVTAGRGDVRLNHIAKDVKIEASRSGDIHVTDLKGSFDLEGRGSDIQLENIAGPVTINGEYRGDARVPRAGETDAIHVLADRVSRGGRSRLDHDGLGRSETGECLGSRAFQDRRARYSGDRRDRRARSDGGSGRHPGDGGQESRCRRWMFIRATAT